MLNRSRLLILWAHALVWSIALPYLSGYVATYDFWAYLSEGKLFWESGIPRMDTDSYLPTVPWVCHNWLASALAYPIFEAGGGAGIRALTYACMLGACLAGYRASRQAGASVLTGLLGLAIAIPSISVGAMPWRPAMLTFVFVALLLAWLQSNRRLWLIPLCFALWANLHAGVVAGLIILAAWTASSFVASVKDHKFVPAFFLLSVTLLSGSATLLNPYGLDYWKMIFVTVGGSNTNITEWQPVPIFSFERAEFKLLVLFAFAVLTVARDKALHRWFILAAFAAMAFRQVRDIPLFGIACVALLPPALEQLVAAARQRWPESRLQTLPRVLTPICAVMTIALFTLWLRSQPWHLEVPGTPNASGTYYPVQAVEYLKQNKIRGNIAIHYPWGEYAAWELHGQCRFSADGRYVTVFPPASLEASLQFTLGKPGWQKLLTDYPTDFALVPRNSTIEQLMLQQSGWTPCYSDAGSVLFAKPAAKTRL